MSWISVFLVLPYSTLFIFLVNLGAVLASSVVFRLMVDVDRLEAQESEVRGYNKSLRNAEHVGDKELVRKLKRREPRIKQLTSWTSKQRFKVIAVTILPFMAVSLMLSSLYLGAEVALFPFDIPYIREFSFSAWYLLSYFAAYLPLSRLFRTSQSLWQDTGVEGGAGGN